VAQLRRWKQQGARVQTAEYFVQCASRRVSLDVLRYFVSDLGANVDRENQNGVTPLDGAAHFGRWDTLRYLVKEFGADVNLPGRIGCTPLFTAAQNGYLLAVMCLGKEHGANSSRANAEGYTP
jgi:ankyrin repeat protein